MAIISIPYPLKAVSHCMLILAGHWRKCALQAVPQAPAWGGIVIWALYVRLSADSRSSPCPYANSREQTPFSWMCFKAATLQRRDRARRPHERCKRDPCASF
ncbi:hypothetical protein C8R44DRAFT_887797 [Mycena epipterygia]|nr:hypothetical protein C8R44DRAFT_887797 [Mycena epipterygia]